MRYPVIISMIIILSLSSCMNPEQEHSDILFIAIDDLNDWTGCLEGRTGVQTPYLDGLAARGVLFSNAHCTAPACSPSRASVMTGVRPSTSGIYANKHDWRKSPKLADVKTIPEYFRDKEKAPTSSQLLA
jgi:arylsulfatase A-like enzyme